MGIFTRNARIVISHHRVRSWLLAGSSHNDRNIWADLFLCRENKRLTRRGSEAVTVYKIR